MTLLIVDPWQYSVCCIGITRCTLLIMFYLYRMCQCVLLAMLRLHMGALMRRFAAESRSSVGLLLPSLCPSGMILLTPYSMEWDWRVSRAWPMLSYWPNCSIPSMVFYYFSLSLQSVNRLVLYGWVFGLIRCISLSLSFALPTF